ncbi:MAG: hypothetical protein N3B01_02670, partial [Verrucomicrobiae bacterium]|nr:hypothetical protein [Verrucomicrobiae bacterium]
MSPLQRLKNALQPSLRSLFPTTADLKRCSPLCSVLLAAIAVRFWWAVSSNSLPFSDFKRYYDIACEFARTGRLAGQGHPFVFQPPAYPLFLGTLFWLFGPSVTVGKLANAVLAVAMLLVFWRVLRQTDFPQWAKLVALVVVGFHPPMITFVSVLGQETLALLFVVLTLWLAPRGGFWLGMCCGLLTLARPQFVLLPFCMAAVGLGQKWYNARAAAWLLAGFAVALAPWALRNWL